MTVTVVLSVIMLSNFCQVAECIKNPSLLWSTIPVIIKELKTY